MIRLSETGASGPFAVRGHWRRACSGGLVVAGFFAVPADAQELPDLQRELREMRQHYDAELKRLRRDYEARIDRLEKQVKAAGEATRKAPSTVAVAARKAPSAATAAPPTPSSAPTPAEPTTNAGLEQPPALGLPPPAAQA